MSVIFNAKIVSILGKHYKNKNKMIQKYTHPLKI